MKKELCITLITLMLTSGVLAEGENGAPGRFGIGYQGVDYGGGRVMNQIALRMAPQPIGCAVVIGEMGETTDSYEDGVKTGETERSMFTIQGKFYYSLIQRPNSDFYIGGLLGLGYNTYEYTPVGGGNVSEDETSEVILGVLAGVEWRFTELPELGINFEIGYNVSYEEDEEKNSTFADYKDESAFSGTTVSLGATYYF